jgi:hypothetical protein
MSMGPCKVPVLSIKWLLPLLIGALGLSHAEQQPEQKPVSTESSDTRIILDVNRVNMLFTVTDKKGRFITDLASGKGPPARTFAVSTAIVCRCYATR